MTVRECYEKFKHLDYLLSDEQWLDALTPQRAVFFDCWQAIREHCENPAPERDVEAEVRRLREFGDAVLCVIDPLVKNGIDYYASRSWDKIDKVNKILGRLIAEARSKARTEEAE